MYFELEIFKFSFWLSGPCRHLQAWLSLPYPPGLHPPCPKPRTPFQPPRTISPCPSDATAGLVSSSHSPALASHGPCQAGPTCRPMPQPSLTPSLSPGRCLISETGAALVPPSYPAPLGWWDRTRLPGPALTDPQGCPDKSAGSCQPC